MLLKTKKATKTKAAGKQITEMSSKLIKDRLKRCENQKVRTFPLNNLQKPTMQKILVLLGELFRENL